MCRKGVCFFRDRPAAAKIPQNVCVADASLVPVPAETLPGHVLFTDSATARMEARSRWAEPYQTAGAFFDPVLTADQTAVIAFADDFHLHAISTADGSRLWQ